MEHKIMDVKPIISFVSVATGRYLDFWKDQVKSAKDYLDQEARIEFVILTDNREGLDDTVSKILYGTNWSLEIGYAPHEEWPFPTLFKFKHILRNAGLLQGETIWHLDADMLFADKNVEYELIEACRTKEMIFVCHPGFYRGNGLRKFACYALRPSLLLRDSKCYLSEQGLGTWEGNLESLAYVEPKKRSNYVCGGSWGGEREAFLKFSEVLSGRIEIDLKSDLIARFHDESHINWYHSNFPSVLLSPKYCYEESYKNLTMIPRKIIAVNKGAGQVWER
jgi:hypothetical protein